MSLMRATCPVHLILALIDLIIQEVQIMKFLFMQIPPGSCHFVILQ
jgi:hypothetical protein